MIAPTATLAYLLLGAVGVIAIALAVYGVVRRSRTLLVAAAAFAVAILAAVLQLPDSVPAPVRSVVAFGAIGGAMSLAWVALVQEPVWLAERLGFKHRSREWEFDRQLFIVIEAFNDVLRLGREADPDAQRRGDLRTRAERLITSLGELDPPSPAWQRLVLQYEALLRMHLQNFAQPLPEEALRKFLELNEAATAAREDLRAEYRAEAARRFRWP